MTQSEAIERLRAALGQIDAVIAVGRDGAAGAEWRLSTSLLFEAVFGPNHQFTKSHRSVDYYIPTSSVFRGDPTTEVARLSREAYERGRRRTETSCEPPSRLWSAMGFLNAGTSPPNRMASPESS